MGRAHDDETRRRRLEEALQESEQRFERLVEAAKEDYWKMIEANAESLGLREEGDRQRSA